MRANQQSGKKEEGRGGEGGEEGENKKSLDLWCLPISGVNSSIVANFKLPTWSLNMQLEREVLMWLSCASVSTSACKWYDQETNQAVWLPEHMPMVQNSISRTTQNLQNTCGRSLMWKNVCNEKKRKTI